jgi:hypothetical protein
MLVVTGGEAMYADLGHFGARPIRASWFSVVGRVLLRARNTERRTKVFPALGPSPGNTPVSPTCGYTICDIPMRRSPLAVAYRST